MGKLGNSKGQAILFAVVGVTVALAIGVTVASRNLSSSSRVSRTDSSSRAYAAAEGGIERLLLLSDSALSSLISANPDCTAAGFEAGPTSYCKLTYPPVAPDTITSYAELKVESFNYNDTASSYYNLVIGNGFTKEIALNVNTQYPGSTIRICWRNPKTALYYYSYDSSGNARSGALYSVNTSLFPSYPYISVFGFSSATSSYGSFPYCSVVNLVNNTAYGLRIRALYDETEVGIYSTGGNLPNQGYKLTSIGKLGQVGEAVAASKKVFVYRSYAYMPSFFDAAIYSSEGQIN